MMALRHGGNTVVRRICPPPPNSLPDENSLRLLAITQTLASILNVAVDNSVLVGALYETCSLSGQDSLGTFGRRVNETDDLEPRTELVFQSERVAAGEFIITLRVMWVVKFGQLTSTDPRHFQT